MNPMKGGIPRESYLMIIGAMKSGTTSLYSYLAEHPEVCECKVKEPEFFTEKQSHGVISSEYSDLWDYDPSVHRCVLEGSTGYTKYPREKGVPGKIRDSGIYPRFIYSLRDPFERIESHYNSGRRNPEWNRGILDPHLISVSDYYLQLKYFEEHFPRDRFLLVDFHEMAEDPGKVLRDIYDFSGLSHSFYPKSFQRKNTTEEITSTEMVYRKHILPGALHRWIPAWMKRTLGKLMAASKPVPKRKLSGSERKRVHDRLRDGMIKLRKEYGFDTAKWSF